MLVNSRWGVGCSVLKLIWATDLRVDRFCGHLTDAPRLLEGSNLRITQASLVPYPQRDRVSVADKERERKETEEEGPNIINVEITPQSLLHKLFHLQCNN